MKQQSVFVPVPVEERLPNVCEQVFLISSRPLNLPKRLATYFGGSDEKEFKRIATHWLEKKEDVFVLTKEELEKVFNAGEDSKENEINGDGETDFNDWLNTQSNPSK